MQILYGPDFKIDEPTIVAIGKFDGLHEGHLRVLDKLLKVSKEIRGKSVVYTFDVNPRLALRNEEFIPLMSNEEKSNELALLGVDYLVYEKFDMKFANMLPEEFVKNILVDKLKIKAVIMGENSTFGRGRLGNVELMKKFGKKYDFKVEVIELMKKDGEIISSTRIREKV